MLRFAWREGKLALDVQKSVGKFWGRLESGEVLWRNIFRGTTAKTATIVQKEHQIQGSNLRVREEEHLHVFVV